MIKYEKPFFEVLLISSIDCIATSGGLGAPRGERDVSYNAIWGATSVDIVE